MRDVRTRENNLRRANRTTEDERARCCSSSRAVASTRAPAHAGRAGAINKSGAAHSISSTRLGSHALRTTAVSLSFRLSSAKPIEVSDTLKTKATLAAVQTLVDTVFGVLPSRTRNSELSEIRQQSWCCSSGVTNPRSTTRPFDERIGGRFGGGLSRAARLKNAS